MNSCTSTSESACEPPLMMFIIGTGSTWAFGSTDVAVERQIGRAGRRVRDGERDAEDRVGADLGLVVGAVQVEHRLVDQPLLAGVVAQQLRAELVEHAEDGLGHALAAVTALVPVTQLDGLEGAGGGARRHCRATFRTVVQDDLDLYRGVAAGVEDLAGTDELNTCHVELPSVPAGRTQHRTWSLSGPPYRRGSAVTDEAGRGGTRVHVRRRRRLPHANTAFTPTMPAQATTSPGTSAYAAAIALTGMPAPSEMMPSDEAMRVAAPDVGADPPCPASSACRSSAVRYATSSSTRSASPVGDRVVVLRPELGAGGHRRPDLGGGLDVRPAALARVGLLRVRLARGTAGAAGCCCRGPGRGCPGSCCCG